MPCSKLAGSFLILFALAFSNLIEVATAQEAVPRPRLALVWMDHHQLLRFGHDIMTDEVERLFRDAATDVEWRQSSATGNRAAPEILITIRPLPPPGWHLGEHAMGAVVKTTTTQRIVYVFFGNVLRTLGLKYGTRKPPSAFETAMLATALARVIAHEVVHSIVPDAPHAESGLMQSKLNRSFLTNPRLQLSPPSTQHLHDGLRKIYLAATEPNSSTRLRNLAWTTYLNADRSRCSTDARARSASSS